MEIKSDWFLLSFAIFVQFIGISFVNLFFSVYEPIFCYLEFEFLDLLRKLTKLKVLPRYLRFDVE
jgi:hypothetical protein